MLADSLRTVLSDAFVLYFKAHSYHWNVEGPDFEQYHSFLGKFYESVFEEVDTVAELIRTLDVYAPTSLARLKALTTVQESEEVIPSGLAMMSTLKADNDKLLASLYAAYKEAEEQTELGISNALQDLITAHEKHSWMLRSFGK